MVKNSLNNSNPSCNFDPPARHKPAQKDSLKSVVMQSALQGIQRLNLKIERCGAWLWIFKADALYETQLRAANFQCSCRKETCLTKFIYTMSHFY